MRNVLSVFSFYTEENWGSKKLRALPRLTRLYQSEPGLNWEGLSGLENRPALPLQRFFSTVIPPEDTGRVVSLKTLHLFLSALGTGRAKRQNHKGKKQNTQSCLECSQGQTRKAESSGIAPPAWPTSLVNHVFWTLWQSMGCCAYVLCTHKGEKAPPGVGTTSPLCCWKSWCETGYFQGPVCE